MFKEITKKIIELVKLINQIEVKFEYLEKNTTSTLKEVKNTISELKVRVEELERKLDRKESEINSKIFALEERFKTVTQKAILDSANKATPEAIAQYIIENKPEMIKKLVEGKPADNRVDGREQ